MSEYSLIILIQSILIFIWVVIVKMRNSRSPEFNNWLPEKIDKNPSLRLEDAFSEYLRKFAGEELSKASTVSRQAAVRLKLIKTHNIDEVLKGNEKYEEYKRSLLARAESAGSL